MTSRKYSRNPPATQVEAWKRALAEHRRGQRNRRWKRPPPPIAGVRVPAPRRDA